MNDDAWIRAHRWLVFEFSKYVTPMTLVTWYTKDQTHTAQVEDWPFVIPPGVELLWVEMVDIGRPGHVGMPINVRGKTLLYYFGYFKAI